MTTRNPPLIRAFSLVEVVLAIAICSFAVIAILGLFTTGLRSTRESEQQIQAADLASMIISMRMTSPTNDITSLPNFVITTSSMTNAYASVNSGAYVGPDGQTTTIAANALYLLTCQAGTNYVTGSSVAQVYLMLSWPPTVPVSSAVGRYELVTEIPIK